MLALQTETDNADTKTQVSQCQTSLMLEDDVAFKFSKKALLFKHVKMLGLFLTNVLRPFWTTHSRQKALLHAPPFFCAKVHYLQRSHNLIIFMEKVVTFF